MKYIGIDVGTTFIKGELFNEKGVCLNKVEISSPTYSQNNVSFLSTNKSKDIVIQIIKSLSESCGGDVESICFSSLGEAFTCIDKKGESINDFILFVSDLGEEECKFVKSQIDEEYVAKIAGCSVNRMYSFSKMIWLKNKHPEIYNKTYKFLMVSQYMVYVLTGKMVCDYSLAARTMCLDVANKVWSDEIINKCGLRKDIFPDLVPTKECVGMVTKEISEKTGLKTNCKVLASGHDQVMAAVGAGLYESNTANDGIGTAECITVLFDKIPQDKNFYKNNFCVVPYIEDGLYACYSFISTGGALLSWHRDQLSPIENELLKSKGENYLNKYSNTIIDLPTNLLVLPHFDGTGTPYLDSLSTGAILGLSQHTTKQEIYYALMEGSAYEMRLNIDLLKKSGIAINKLTANGGGAKSSSWLKIKTNIYNKKIATFASAQGGTFGCFLLCYLESHKELNLKQIIKKFVKIKDCYKVDKDLKSKYDIKFKQYKKIYPAMKKIMQ